MMRSWMTSLEQFQTEETILKTFGDPILFIKQLFSPFLFHLAQKTFQGIIMLACIRTIGFGTTFFFSFKKFIG